MVEHLPDMCKENTPLYTHTHSNSHAHSHTYFVTHQLPQDLIWRKTAFAQVDSRPFFQTMIFRDLNEDRNWCGALWASLLLTEPQRRCFMLAFCSLLCALSASWASVILAAWYPSPVSAPIMNNRYLPQP